MELVELDETMLAELEREAQMTRFDPDNYKPDNKREDEDGDR